jgi:hypothetical protein
MKEKREISHDLVDQLFNEFLRKAKERGISGEYLCDPQRTRLENKVRQSIAKLVESSKD